MGGPLDVDSSRGRHARPHGAVRLPSRSAGSVSGCKLRLAEVLRRSGACARRGCRMMASTSVMISKKTKVSRGLVAGFWIFTALFCLEMSFTAYYELLRLPEAAQAFTRLGFPAASFRVELSWAKVAGVAALLMPMVPARGVIYVIKEWAYAGFAINLVSALIAHLSIGDRPEALAPSAATSVLWGLSYFFWRRLQMRSSEATDCS